MSEAVKKPALDDPAATLAELSKRMNQMYQTLQIYSGQRGTRTVKLDTTTATATQCAAKINELIDLLQ